MSLATGRARGHGAPGGGEDKASTTRLGVLAAILDLAILTTAMVLSHSALLLADMLKTGLEFVAILMSWLCLRRLARGGHHQFEYGMGKLENLSSMAMGLLMVVCVLVIAGNSALHMLSPSTPPRIGIIIGAGDEALFSAINAWLWLRSRAQARQDNSPLMQAQASMYQAKFIGSVFIFGSLSASLLLGGLPWARFIDPVASLVVAGSMLAMTFGILKGSFQDLMDRTLDESDQIVILSQLAKHYHDYHQLHGIRSRRAGGHSFVEVFLEFEPQALAGQVQAFADKLVKAIEREVPGARASVVLATQPPPGH